MTIKERSESVRYALLERRVVGGEWVVVTPDSAIPAQDDEIAIRLATMKVKERRRNRPESDFVLVRQIVDYDHREGSGVTGVY